MDCCPALPCHPSLSLARVLQEQARILAGSSRWSEAADRCQDIWFTRPDTCLRYLEALTLG